MGGASIIVGQTITIVCSDAAFDDKNWKRYEFLIPTGQWFLDYLMNGWTSDIFWTKSQFILRFTWLYTFFHSINAAFNSAIQALLSD